jgi:hypothetical protein
VILYKGRFAYDAVNVFVDELAAGLAALGRETVLIDLTVDSQRSRIETELARPFECIVAFGAIGTRPRNIPAGSHMYDRLQGPYVAVLVDHPSYHLDRFTIDNMILTCYDRTHVSFVRKYFGGRKRVAFLPHGGSMAGSGPAADSRPIGILFPGTYADPDAEYASLRASLPEHVFDIMDFVVERLLLSDGEPMEDALSAVLSAEGREDEWPRLCLHLPAIEAFVKPYKRMEVLRRLDHAGLAVELLGSWPESLFRHHRMRPTCSYGDMLRLMQQSKLVLNMGFVPDGSHERVFSALLNGALPVSDGNPFLEESFSRDADMLFFRWTKLDELPGRVAAVLDDRVSLAGYPSRAAQLGQAHTWAARAGSLLALVKSAGTAGD